MNTDPNNNQNKKCDELNIDFSGEYHYCDLPEGHDGHHHFVGPSPCDQPLTCSHQQVTIIGLMAHEVTILRYRTTKCFPGVSPRSYKAQKG